MIGLLWTNLEFYSGYWVMIYCEQAINVYPWRDWIYIFKLLEPFFFLSSVYEHALCMKAFSSLFVLFFVCFFPFPWLEGGMSVQIFLKCIFSDMKFKGVCVWGGGCVIVFSAKKWKQASIVLFTFSEFRFTPYLYTGSRSASPCYYYLLCQVALYCHFFNGRGCQMD